MDNLTLCLEGVVIYVELGLKGESSVKFQLEFRGDFDG